MISAGDFRKGTTFEMDGDVYQIIDFQHVKPGKGAAFVRTKIKSVKSGGSREMTFNPNDKFEVAKIDNATIRFHDGKAFQVNAPNFVELEVVETEPGVKGDSATGANKPAKVETGAVVTVPLFINNGDKIKIDTRTNEYLSRV